MARITDECISAAIKAARIKAGIKQEELAHRLNCSRVTISTMESKPTEYPIAKLYLLANAIGCPIDDFFKD